MFQTTEAQESFRKSVRQVTEEKIAPRAAEIDREDSFPWDIFEVFKENNWMGLAIPKEYGGTGADFVTLCIQIEEVSRVSAACALITASSWLGMMPIMIAGSDELKKRTLTPFAKSEGLGAFALTERHSGSDASVTKTTAVKEGDHYVVNGSKCFITHGGLAKNTVVFCMTNPDQKVRGISAIVVPDDAPGFTTGKIEDKMGIRGAQVAELDFKDVQVPAGNLIGEENRGFRYAMMTLDRTRPTIGAQAVGIAQGAMDTAIAYSKDRVAFGSPISNLQAVQFLLADMAIQTEAARYLIYTAASGIDNNVADLSYISACAKTFASDMAVKVALDAIQVMGGHGYMKNQPLERMLRDAKITQIYEGTNQIQRVVISRALLA